MHLLFNVIMTILVAYLFILFFFLVGQVGRWKHGLWRNKLLYFDLISSVVEEEYGFVIFMNSDDTLCLLDIFFFLGSVVITVSNACFFFLFFWFVDVKWLVWRMLEFVILYLYHHDCQSKLLFLWQNYLN